MLRLSRFAFVLLLTLIVIHGALPAAAQQSEDGCTPEITTAVSTAAEVCQGLNRNTVCYGNTLIKSVERTAESDSTTPFDKPGDQLPVQEIQSLDLSAYNMDTGEWGIALLTLQANLPDTLPGQGVTIILFGDASIQADPGAASDTSPMQAIRFTSGIGKTDCTAAPNGLLVQTPQGVASVELTINGINVQLGSTAYLHMEQTDAGDPFLDFELLEGHSTLTVGDGEPVSLDGGFGVDVPVDSDGMAAAQPSEPDAITVGEGIPSLLALLPETIALPAAPVEDAGTVVIPRVGTYHLTVLNHTNNGCSEQMVDSVLHLALPATPFSADQQQHFIDTGELLMGQVREPLQEVRIINDTTIDLTLPVTVTTENCSVMLETRATWVKN